MLTTVFLSQRWGMESEELKQFKIDILWILVFGLLFAVVGAVVSLAKESVYESSSRVKVTIKPRPGQDVLSALRAESLLAENLAIVVNSQNFLDLVATENESVLKLLPKEQFARLKWWRQAIKAQAEGQNGILRIQAESNKPETAHLLALAATQTLLKNINRYHGAEEGEIALQVLDFPLVSAEPAAPQPFINIIGGMLVGGLLGFIFILLRPQQGRRTRFAVPKPPNLMI